MKYVILTLTCVALLAGCASFEEAYYVDREFGMANNDAFDRQIVHKDYKYAGEPVNDLSGIHAEPIMETYQGTFSEGFTSEDIDISETGTEGN